MANTIRPCENTDTYPAMGTSHFNHTVKATPEELKEILKTLPGDSDKSQYDFEATILIKNKPNIFTVYDWKVSRTIRMTDQAIFNIGAENEEISRAVQQELNMLLSAYRLKTSK